MLELHECKLYILNRYQLPIVSGLWPSHFKNALLMTQMASAMSGSISEIKAPCLLIMSLTQYLTATSTVIRVRCHKLTREKGGKKCEEQLNCLPVHQVYCREHFHKMLVAGTTLSPYPQCFSCPRQIGFQHFVVFMEFWQKIMTMKKRKWHTHIMSAF